MNDPRLAPILATVALVVVLAACQSSTEPQKLIIPTALTCLDCPAVAVTRIIDGDTLDTAHGRLRLFVLVALASWLFVTSSNVTPAEAKELAEEALEVAANVLDDVWEVYEPQPTLEIPAQRNFVSWETPRGTGYVASDEGTPPGLYLAMVLDPLLSRNGIVLAPSSKLRPASTLFIRCLNRAGVPWRVVHLAAQGGPAAAAALADDTFQFAVVDMSLQDTRQVYERLAETRESLGQNWIKALISMDDGLSYDGS